MLLKQFPQLFASSLHAILILAFLLINPSLSVATTVTLKWDANSPTPDGYRVYRRIQGESYDYASPCWSGTTTTCSVDGLSTGTTYYFVVRAYVGSQESLDSNEAEFVNSSNTSTSTGLDSDGDGVLDADDAFPQDAAEWIDSDQDGIGNNADSDDDNDGMPDDWEALYGLDHLKDDSMDDTDGDGIDNHDEYINGTDPTVYNTQIVADTTMVIDDGEAGTSSTGSWKISGGVNPYGAISLYSQTGGSTYIFTSYITGNFDIEIWWTVHSTRCTNVPVQIYDDDTLLETVYVNQQQNGGQWNFLGTYEFSGQARVVIVSEGTSTTCADAVKFAKPTNVASVIDSSDTTSGSNSSYTTTAGGDSSDTMVIDDGGIGTSYTGKWLNSGGADPYESTSLYSKEAGANYTFTSSITGSYDVEIWWTVHSTRCTNVPIMIYDGDTLLETVYANQQQDGGQWNFLGTYEFSGQARVVVVSEGVGTTCADAVEFTKSSNVISNSDIKVIDNGGTGTLYSGQWSTSGGVNPYGSKSLYSKEAGATYTFAASIAGSYDVEMWWTVHSTRSKNVPVKIYDGNALLGTVYSNQQQDGGQWNFLGTYEFRGGQGRVVIVSEGTSTTCADAVRYLGN